jgi:hypothetical protein
LLLFSEFVALLSGIQCVLLLHHHNSAAATAQVVKVSIPTYMPIVANAAP